MNTESYQILILFNTSLQFPVSTTGARSSGNQVDGLSITTQY
jgi:hypothetical protein